MECQLLAALIPSRIFDRRWRGPTKDAATSSKERAVSGVLALPFRCVASIILNHLRSNLLGWIKHAIIGHDGSSQLRTNRI